MKKRSPFHRRIPNRGAVVATQLSNDTAPNIIDSRYRMAHLRILIFFLLLPACGVFAQEAVIQAPLVLKNGGTHLTIPQRDAKGAPHDYAGNTCGGAIDYTVLHSAIWRDGTLYVVFTSKGRSKEGGNRGGRCGGGYERQINWMAIRDGRVMSHQRRDIESCWRDAYGEILGWKNGKLLWNCDERDGAYECFFDRTQPEKGLQVSNFKKLEGEAAATRP